jgi:hypothetical protein
MKDILYNYEWMCVIMAVFIFLFTFVLKYPIKLATKRIKDERKRKMANATILLIPFMLGILCEYAYTHWLLDVVIPFSLVSGLGYGTAAVSLYGVVERFFGVKIPNPYETKEGQAVISLVDEVSKDGKVDENDKDAVTEFLNMVK